MWLAYNAFILWNFTYDLSFHNKIIDIKKKESGGKKQYQQTKCVLSLHLNHWLFFNYFQIRLKIRRLTVQYCTVKYLKVT